MRGAGLAVFLALLAVPASAVAAEPPAQVKAELDAAWAAAEKTAVMGPTEIKLLDQATLKIPAGEAFIPSAEANRIMAALGNSTGAPRQGLVVGRGKDDSWLVDVVWIQEGYVRDGDAKEWKADELLQSLKDGTEEDNSGRLARGLPALDVVGWVEPPAYDPRTHRLVWSLSLQERGMPEGQPQTINYNTYALGRDGYFSLDLIAGSDTIAADKSVARDLLASLNYVPGKRYEEFNGSTDKVAAYGLGALIGVVAAKKLGLLAVIGVFLLKMWKIGLLLLAGVGAAIRRFFGGRGNEAPEAEYYAAEPQTPVAEPDTHAAEPESHADEPGSEPALQAGEPGP